jgi:hypothetical protein
MTNISPWLPRIDNDEKTTFEKAMPFQDSAITLIPHSSPIHQQSMEVQRPAVLF